MKTNQLVLAIGLCIAVISFSSQVKASSLDRLIGYTPGQLSTYQANRAHATGYQSAQLAAAWSLYRKAIESAQPKGAASGGKKGGIRIGRTAAMSAGPGSSQRRPSVRNKPQSSQSQTVRVRIASQAQRSAMQFPELTQFRQYRTASASTRGYQQSYRRTPVQQYGYSGNYYQQYGRQYGGWGTDYYPGAYSYYGANCYGST